MSNINRKRHRVSSPNQESTSKRIKLNPEMENKDQSSAQIDNSNIQFPSLPEIPILTNEWVRASDTRNYIMGDPLVDWLKMHGQKAGFVEDCKLSKYDQRLDFEVFILKQGTNFEENIMVRLREKFPNDMVIIPRNGAPFEMKETLDAMRKGIPLIAQAHIWNPKYRVHGHPDLLVRSDYLNKLVECPVISDKIEGCIFSPDWHYRVVDIKFATLRLKADLTTLLAQGSSKAFKSQLSVYNLCLEYIQKFAVSRAYLLGRGWEGTKKGKTFYSEDPFSKLGVVDFSSSDSEIINQTTEAISWIRLCSAHGHEWKIFPHPSVPELYPNMTNDNCTGWDHARKIIANQLKEITLLWQCGLSSRQDAHNQGIFEWDHPDLTAKILGINGPKLSPTLDKILNANRSSNPIPKINTNIYNWRIPACEFFIDVESVSSIRSIGSGIGNMIYLIGIGQMKEEKWIYNTFIVQKLDLECENEIVVKLLTFLLDQAEHAKFIKLYHYAHADQTLISKCLNRLKLNKQLNSIVKRIGWCDLYRIIRDEPVCIKGALNFSLKSIVSALFAQGKININYKDNAVQSGMDGIMTAIVAGSQTNTSFSDHDLIRETIKYNEVDCKALQEILFYFRKEL